MRIFVVFIFFFSGFVLSAQEKNSLLWEISGNGLDKSSYLYGTMHVSKKIAFRLDDVFYEALDQSDMVALESDPATWLESDLNNGFMGYQNNGGVSAGFYTRAFSVRAPTKEQLASYLAFEDGMLNNILYRTNEYSQNFEEETYLDMFIYQAGAKFEKPIVALEDLEEATALVGRASMNAVKPKPDEWLQKRMKRQDLMLLMQDAYRERNINLLDSIDRAMYTDHYLENMLYIRNRNMAHSLDSVMRHGKVFAGIGAAHLPGEQGVISLLRDKGYTVKPLISRSTSRGLQLKTKFEKKRKSNAYLPQGPDDDFFTIGLPEKLYPVSEFWATTYIAPDLANGSYLIVNRIPTYAYLKKDGIRTLAEIDALLFENIPGKILDKKRIQKGPFEGLDIRNQLKNGDHQRYQIFITPLEILIFKMGGEGDFVKVSSDTIFNSLKFKNEPAKKLSLSSGFKDFSIRLPSLYSFKNRFRSGKRNLEAYDSLTDTYYFLRRATLNDFSFIEEDTFELKHIQKRFLQDLKIKPSKESFVEDGFVSTSKLDPKSRKSLHLNTVFRRGDYYLMGVLTEDPEEASSYFSSFKLNDPSYSKAFEKIRDTALFFTTVSPVEPPKFVESSNNYYQGRSKPKPYDAYTKKTRYTNKNDESIAVELTKSHDFLMFKTIDSVWALRKKQYAKKKLCIQEECTAKPSDGLYELQLTLTDTASTRGILVKNVLKGGLLYELKAVIDTVQQPSRFVSEFFSNFKPLDTLIGRDILEDKTQDFFTALRENDSIASKGYRFLRFDESHIDSLTHYIENFDFPSDKKHIRSHLIQRLGKIEDPRVVSFFRNYYANSYDNSTAQAKILQSVANSQDEESTELLLNLLTQDLPLVSKSLEIQKIFSPYRDSLQLARKLFPEILDYGSIPEYKSPVFSLLASLKSEGLLKPKVYKKYKKQILNDARIQLKRQLGSYNSDENKRVSYNRANSKQNLILRDYATLLFPFRNEKHVRQFFDKLLLLKDPEIQCTYAVLLAENGEQIPQKLLNGLAADINSRAKLYDGLESIDKSTLFPSSYASQQFMAESALFKKRKFSETRDSLKFLEKRPIMYRGDKYNGYYFILRNKQNKNENGKIYLVVYEQRKPLSTKPFYQSKGLRIEDTDTEEETIGYAQEAFILKDRKRAMVYRPDRYQGYGHYGY
ncbi:TraB/GumN family protein [Poritiphilus flavus]|uniref:TraB/GumN family protein n=1 Tax=Poritiphilus flavus TaxID=2697053 RepID=A0A6L9E7U6_9FLAO|nr:TraB/GumN family protein [Poritiphilus flavus]NAS10855.1 TraB/GumN family protein [Poritiphilus flavus]